MCIEKSIGKRVLLRLKDRHHVQECRILEISPSGEWVKLHFLNPESEGPFQNDKHWIAVAEVEFVEALPEPEAG
jgi:hypothetical protein